MNNKQKDQPSSKPQVPLPLSENGKKSLKHKQDMNQKKSGSEEKKGGCCG